MTYTKTFTGFLLGIITVINSFGQGNSPYSELGLGNHASSTFQSNFATGGLGASYKSKYQLNYLNPASYSSIAYTVGEAGVYSSTNFFSNGNETAHESTFNLGHFGFGFPLSSNAGFAFGIKPFTQTGFNYSYSDLTNDNIEITRKFSGKGSINELFSGFGYQIGNLAVGVNGHYYFGTISKVEQMEFLTSNYSSIREQNFLLARGWTFTGGATYSVPLGEKEQLNVGATYQYGSTISSRNYRIINNYNVETVAVDEEEEVTIENHAGGDILFTNEETPTEGSIQLPGTYRAGISYQTDNLFLGADYENSSWETLTINGLNAGLGRSQKISIGGEYTPILEVKGLENYWKSVIYRGGISIGQSSILANGNPLNEYGIKFGLGFPLKKMKYEAEKFGSYLFTSIGYDYLGGKQAGITEHFIKINFSVVLNDKWFVKRKFD